MIEKVLSSIINKLVTSDYTPPEWDNVTTWSNKATDGHRVRGWSLQNGRASGTVILCHGFRQHAGLGPVVKAAKFLMKGQDWALIALNFRSHGPSRGDEKYLPTFGEAEMWDIQAALEYAERHGFPKPYVLIGYSMGAMAASRVAQSDTRVSGAFLISPPYKARHALRTVSKRRAFKGAYKLIESSLNRTYRSRCKSNDIIGKGDPRRHNMSPLHAPYLCYWIGNRDEYDWKSLYKKLYKRWYGGLHVGDLNELPVKPTDRRAWFVVGDSKHHIGRNGWRQIEPVFERFLSLLSQR